MENFKLSIKLINLATTQIDRYFIKICLHVALRLINGEAEFMIKNFFIEKT